MKKVLKKILASLMVAVMVLTAAPLSGIAGLEWSELFGVKASALASSGQCGTNVTYTFDSGTGLLLISGSGAIQDYLIGSSIFYGNKSIKYVVIAQGITRIGEGLFVDCTGITSVIIPDSVTSIGLGAFADCSGLTSISIPDSVTSIEAEAFMNCSGLSNITIPDSVKSIEQEAFLECTKLTSIKLPEGLTKIEWNTFLGCSSLPSIVIPDSVTSIGNGAFESCTGLTSVTIPDSVISIGGYAFYDCTGLTNVTIPNGVATIGEKAFNGVLNVIYNGSASGAPWGAEYNNLYEENKLLYSDSSKKELVKCLKNIQGSITIPDSVTSIDEYAFYDCKGITSITIPDSVTSIGFYAFSGCSELKKVNITSIENWCKIKFYGSISNPLYFANYLYLNNEIVTDLTIPDSVTSIGAYAFFNCTGLTSVIIPDSVASIGEWAFYDCTGLTSVAISDSVRNIGRFAFRDCTGLRELTMPCSVITDYSFAGSTNIEKVTLTKGTGVMTSGYEISPWQLTENAIKEVIIKDGITNISDYAFSGFTGLTSIEIPDSVTNISDYAFCHCTGLTSIEIPGSVTSIGSYVFSGCTGLTNITISNGVTSVGNEAFSDCTGITSIEIPDSVTSMDSDVFLRCSSLKNVQYKAKNCQCGFSVFDASGVETITVSANVESIPDKLFAYCPNLQNVIFESDDYIEMGNAIFDESYNAVICCKENSYMHYYAERKGLQYCILDDENNPNFSVENDILVSYNGSAESVFVSSASKIGFGAFSGNETVSSVELASNVTRIYSQAFKNCTNLEKIIIPKNVSSIGDNAFAGCDNLTVWCYAGSYAEAFAVNHDIPVQYITLELSDSIITLADSETANLTASFSTAMLDENKLIWTSSDPSVVSVNDGTVTVLDVGEAEIIATTSSGLSASCTVVVDLKLNNDTEAEIDTENEIVTGIDFVNKDVNGIKNLFANSNIAVTSSNGKVGTGDTVTLCRANGEAYRTVSVVIFGDVNGDGVYDGQDAMIVSCLANGLLTESDVSEAVYMAADCNHDGIIDQLDVELLQKAGALLAEVDQTKSEEELITTSSAYVEYLNLIDQTVETETTEETAVVEDTPTDDKEPVQINWFQIFVSFLKTLLNIVYGLFTL